MRPLVQNLDDLQEPFYLQEVVFLCLQNQYASSRGLVWTIVTRRRKGRGWPHGESSHAEDTLTTFVWAFCTPGPWVFSAEMAAWIDLRTRRQASVEISQLRKKVRRQRVREHTWRRSSVRSSPLSGKKQTVQDWCCTVLAQPLTCWVGIGMSLGLSFFLGNRKGLNRMYLCNPKVGGLWDPQPCFNYSSWEFAYYIYLGSV